MKRLSKQFWFTAVFLMITVAWLNLPGCSESKTKQKQKVENSFVGSQTCKNCHSKSFDQWSDSHHDWAMKEANDQTVLGDFNNSQFSADGVEYLFHKKDNKFLVTTTENERVTNYEVSYTFGVSPLQQYLIKFPDGKIQALRASWDIENGIWFNQYKGQKIASDDWLHWTQGGQRWNTMCAECHSTNLKKKYNKDQDSFETSFSEINVGCESCHGKGAKHVAWAESGKDGTNSEIINAGLHQTDQIEACGACHSRRVKLTENMDPSKNFSNQFLIQNINNSFYHADGQILEEDYVLGSFMQSKMYHEKVKCTDCHNAHTLELKFEDNALCTQCHEPKYDSKDHHFHAVNTTQSKCINCHMTGKTYMGNDFRRDHSFRVPRPDQSVKFNTPNACINCHEDKSNEWAADKVVEWYGPVRKENYSDKILLASTREFSAQEKKDLLAFISNIDEPDLARSTIIEYLDLNFTQEEIQALIECLRDSSPFVRYNALVKFENLPVQERQAIALTHINDESRLVRIGAAQLIVGTNIEEYNVSERSGIRKALLELEEMLKANSDFPLGRLQYGDYYLKKNMVHKAISEYEMALKMDSRLSLVYSNLATAYNLVGNNEKALQTLNTLIELEINYARGYYLRGILLYEMDKKIEALKDLEKANSLEPENERYLRNLSKLRSELG